jgi:hypothetical protein
MLVAPSDTDYPAPTERVRAGRRDDVAGRGSGVGSGSGSETSDSVALSVHGPVGVLDLVVPGGASMWDVAREYAERSGLGTVPLMYTRAGAVLSPDLVLAEAGIASGTVLVASTGAQRPTRRSSAPPRSRAADQPPGPLSAVWFSVAAAAGVLAGWLTATTGTADLRTPAVVVLLLAALAGVVPVGRYARLRALTAPVFAGAAAYPLLWDPDPLHQPTIVGGAALAAAVTAGVARALAPGPDEGLRVWIAGGGLVFVAGALAAVVDASPAVVWSVLLLAAMLASRFVPMMAIDVPDHHLIDLERLAASAWSARERPPGRRGRTVVSARGVAEVARSGARTTTAASAALAAVACLSSTQLLAVVDEDIDRIGARCMVFFVGASLLLAARSYRHVAARGLLRLAGLFCWAVLAWGLLAELPGPRLGQVAGAATALALPMVVAAVATGRGWRSAWWSRRAEVAESLAGAAAIASLVVSSGLFEFLWELTSANAPSV